MDTFLARSSIMNLPTELLLLVLRDVDGRDLWMFRRVCKRWNDLLSDVHIQRQLLPGLSWEEPFEHAKALAQGMPFRVSRYTLGGNVIMPTLHENLLFFTALDHGEYFSLSLDLRTGEALETYELHACDGWVDVGKIRYNELQFSHAIAVYDGVVCRWTEEGIDIGGHMLQWTISAFKNHGMAMNSRYIFLFGTDEHFNVFRIDRLTKKRYYFTFGGGRLAYSPVEPKRAGPLLWHVEHYLLYLGEWPTVQPVPVSRAVWRETVYDPYGGIADRPGLRACATSGASRMMGRVDHSNKDYILANDDYLIACDATADTEILVFHMNPDSIQGQVLHRDGPPGNASGFKSGLLQHKLCVKQILQAEWTAISADFVLPSWTIDPGPDVHILSTPSSRP